MKYLKNQNKKRAGFTIVELLIVIVVIGILAALVLNTFSGVQQKARNAHTLTLVKAYYTAIQAYVAENGSYPPDWACLGVGYPDVDGDGKGDCDGTSTYTSLEENTAFNDAIRPYIGGSENNKIINPTVVNAPYDLWGVGAMYTYNEPTTLDGEPLHRWIVYHLEGVDTKCPIGPLAKMSPGFPTFTSTSDGVSEPAWENGVRCWIPLQEL
jgi:prepilin-type N-terminal cleavage/methylation domain-containing protein